MATNTLDFTITDLNTIIIIVENDKGKLHQQFDVKSVHHACNKVRTARFKL